VELRFILLHSAYLQHPCRPLDWLCAAAPFYCCPNAIMLLVLAKHIRSLMHSFLHPDVVLPADMIMVFRQVTHFCHSPHPYFPPSNARLTSHLIVKSCHSFSFAESKDAGQVRVAAIIFYTSKCVNFLRHHSLTTLLFLPL